MSDYNIDPDYGIGAVSLNANTPRVIVNMLPSRFLELAHHMDPAGTSAARTISWIRARLTNGIGYPVLHIAPPLEWRHEDFSSPARVIESNGRHRMYALLDAQGDYTVPVMLVPWQDITQSELNTWLARMCREMISQDGNMITGELWTANHEG
jgi:hypothetical protein